MKKFISKIVGISLGIAMAIGVGVSIATSARDVVRLDAAASYSFAGNKVTFSSQGLSNDTQYSEPFTNASGLNTFQVQFTGGGNDGKYYTTGSGIRTYGGGSVVVTALNSNILTEVVFTWSGSSYAAPTDNIAGYTLASSTGTWSGSSSAISLTRPSGSGHWRLQSVQATVSSGSGSTTYSVTYNGTNSTGGSVPVDGNTYETSETVTVLGNTNDLARTGYTWSGWSLNEDGSGTAYGPTYTTTYTVASSNINFYPIWTKNVVPLPESGTITIDPTILGSYGTDVEYSTEEDSTPDSVFNFSCTDVTKGTGDNTGKIQFKKGSGTLYSTTPLSYIRSVSIGGSNTSDATVTYGKTANAGCTSATVGTDNTYFKIVNGNASYARYWTITITYSLEAPAALTDIVITSGAESVKKVYDAGDVFDPTGLVIKAKWDDVLDEANDVAGDVVWTPNPLTAGTTTVTGTYTFGSDEATVEVTGLTVAAPNAILDGNTNVPAGISDSANSDVGEGKVGLSGVKYGYYAIQTYNSNLEFNKDVSDSYIGNNESYGKYIRKIRVVLTSAANFAKLTMFKGDSAIPETTDVATGDSGTSRVYNFNNDSEYFALKQTTTGTYIQVVKIEVFLGSNVPVISSVVGSIKAGTHYEGTTLSASDFNVTVNWTEGKAATYPTEDFTWTVNGVNNGSLNEGDNSVIITYNGIPSSAFNVVGAPAAAKDVVENTLQTKTSLSYHYSAADNIATDTLTKTFTGVSGQSYADWSGKVGTSGAIYAGNSYPTSNDKDYIQLRYNNDSGIVTTGSGGKAKTVTVSWNGDTADGRTLNIYGKNSAYSSAADLHNEETRGTLIGTIVKGTSTSLSITSDYAYIGIKVNANSLYLDSIDIDWAGQPSYTFTNAYLGFGGSISKTLWNRLDSESTILGYGIMLATNSYLNGDSIKELYDLARYYEDNVDDTFEAVDGKSYSMVKGTSIKNFYNSVSTLPNESGSDYIWYLNKGLTCTNAGLTKGFTAVAFIRTADDEIVFLGEISKSAAQVAEDMINANPNDAIDENYLDGSLGYLAGLAS